MIEVKKLSYQHSSSSLTFFKDISFTLDKGKIHEISGKNGSGKSTLLHLLAGDIDKQSVLTGEISIGCAVLVHQKFDAMLADRFNFVENLSFAKLGRRPSFFRRLPKNPIDHKLLYRFHIRPETPVFRLSGGQRQILALIMVLQKQPDVILLDEPTAAMDEENAKMVMDFLQTVPDVTFLIVSHDRDLVSPYINGKRLRIDVQKDGARTLHPT